MEPVVYTRKGDVHTFRTGLAGLETLVVDHTGVPAEGRNGLAKQLLASSALACYGMMLAAVLDARKIAYTELTGTASMELGPNAGGQGRVRRMRIAFTVSMPADGAKAVFERCARIMQGGCLVTGSLHDGIEMEYALDGLYGRGGSDG